MKLYDGDKSQCPCCKECIDCNAGFQKVVDLENAGLVIYRHTTRTEDLNKDTGIIEFATKTTEDVFILHNTKNMDITSADYLPEIEENKITCPRCRKIIEHAQKLLKKLPTINRNDVKGICEHCRTKDAPCFECEEVAKKFLANRTAHTENKKEKVKQWLSKIKYLLKDAVVENDTSRGRARAHSELSIDQLCRVTPESGRELQVKQMFPPDRTNFVGAFPPSIEKRKKMFAHFPKLEELEHPIVFIDPPETVGRPSTFRPTAGFTIQDRNKEYGSDVDSEDLKAMFRPPLPEEEKQEKAKKLKLGEYIPPVPFQSEEDFKSGKDESITSLERIRQTKSRQKTNEEIGKVSHRSEVPQQIGTHYDAKRGPLMADFAGKQRYKDIAPKTQKAELEIKHSLSSMKSVKGTHRKTEESPDKIRKYHSEEALLTTIDGVTGEMIKQDFSYVFPKILSPEKKKLKRQKSSSELIKDTQDMLQAKAEEKEKKLEEERKKKLEEEEKKLAREEKRKELEAKKNAEEERKRLDALQKNRQEKAEEAKRDTVKKDTAKKDEKEKVTPTASTATTKSKTKDSQKESKPKEPREPKEPKEPKELKQLKEPKQHKEPKQPKGPKEPKVDKNALKANKDAAKLKKEQEKREKEERLRKEKEEKERLKKDKDDQLRKEKEMKEKEKELNAREKEKENKLKEEKKAATAYQKELDKARQEKLDVEKREREDARSRLRNAKEDEANTKPEPEKPKAPKKIEVPGTKELNIKSIKVRKPTADDLILQLLKLKQSDKDRMKPKRLEDLNLTKKDVKNHKVYHKQNAAVSCSMCNDSDIELDAESLVAIKDEDKMEEIIIGPKVFKYKPPLIDKQEEQNVPIIFQSTFDDNHVAEVNESAMSPKRSPVTSGKRAQKTEQEVPKGVIRYALSDRTFINKGWTMLPTEKVVRKMNVYRMRPAHPEFDWFEHNKNKRLMQYDTGEKLAEFDDNGRGRWFYRNGRMALDYYDAEELNAQQRFVIYSSGQPDERGRAQPYTVLATFDYLGNGIVFDHSGKIRLKYNQTEGVVLDRSIGPVSHWKWHTLNDPPILQQVMIDTQMAHKDPGILKLGGPHDCKARPDNEDMLAIEFDNFIKEKSKKLSQSFKPFQIKMKALKINEYFSLKVLDQATVYLIYRDGTTSLKLNIGMVLDHKEIVDTDTAEVGEVSNNMERLPARTDSLAELQKSIAHAQHYDRSRTDRELRIRPTMSCGSADRLVSAASRPLSPLGTGPPDCATTADCYCKCARKPSANNLYYDTRLC